MKISMYPKLAWGGIWKNKKLYLPYIFTAVGMVTMFYIVAALGFSEEVRAMPGGASLSETLRLGSGVVAIFSAIFLFYTSSFLMRRRTREFGLYNILGMGKRHIGVIMVFETTITAVFSVASGIGLGFLFSKLAEAALRKIMIVDPNFEMFFSVEATVLAIPIYAAIFAVILIVTLLRVRLSNPIALLHSENAGERPPRANPILAIGGALLLGAAYYIAIVTKDPVEALGLFFVAVIMVIVGTYAIFIAGSVFICRVLKANKNYYYKPDHFVSVSSMSFRMKRNGAGLASICILLTMVLVMLATTTALYTSENDVIAGRYPREILGRVYFKTFGDMGRNATFEKLEAAVKKQLTDAGCGAEDYAAYRCVSLTASNVGGTFISTSDPELEGKDTGVYALISFIPLDDYNRLAGTDYTLGDNEALIYTVDGEHKGDYTEPTITVKDAGTYTVKEHVGEVVDLEQTSIVLVSKIVIVINEVGGNLSGLENHSSLTYYFGVNVGEGKGAEARSALWNLYLTDEDGEIYSGLSTLSVSSREIDINDFFSLYGGLFFLGIMLSIVFTFAAVLIIYYKQISEGYEDRSRFEIMQKVGMTGKEIKRSINSQMRTVFILPIVFAAIHLCFALPIVSRLLLVFGLSNLKLLIFTALACVAAMSVIYLIVYKLTAGAYYRIVRE